MSSPDPQQLGEFEILEKLGRGGMGAVYKARQTSLGRIVALKVLPRSMSADDEFIVRFKAEARAAASLNHPGIVQVYAAGADDGVHYFAMEYVDGESLQARLHRKGRLNPLEALAICTHVANALNHGWQRAKIIHRDIKPDNIFLSNEGAVKLGDLGLAKSLGSESSHLTQTGTSMGTPYYISPEQAHGDATVDFRSDIYSLGCTLYHLVTGQTPYMASSPMAVMIKHITAPPPDIFKVWPECPPPLGPLLARLLAKDPAKRPQSYEEAISAMMAAHDQIQNPPATLAPKKKSPATAAPPRTPAKIPTPVANKSVRRDKPGMLVYVAVSGVVLALLASVLVWAPWKKSRTPPASAAAPSIPSPTPAPTADAGFIPLFNGRDLSGWEGDAKLWSVRDGAIVGQATTTSPANDNTFLIFKGGPAEDFVLLMSFMLRAGNSGVQYRSRMIDPKKWILGGYQADLNVAKREWQGVLYEERGNRGVMAGAGERVRWSREGKKEVLAKFDGRASVNSDGWNALRITAKGNHLVHEINGVTTADCTDEDPARQSLTGMIGLQLLKGTKVEVKFRDILLKRLPTGNLASAPPKATPTPQPTTPAPVVAIRPTTPPRTPPPPGPAPGSFAPVLKSSLNPAGGIVFEGSGGPGKGRHIVLLAGDEEYRSEELLPQLAKILATHHGFKCTVLFSINPQTGAIDPNAVTNQPGLEALSTADLCIMMLRFRSWPDAQMKHFVDYFLAGKPFVALRTSTHAFNGIPLTSPYAKYNFNSAIGGFGKQVLGESWTSHWGQHKAQATRALIEPFATSDPILRGVTTFIGPTDVYEASPPPDAKILMRGQVLSGMTDIGGAANGRKRRVNGQEQGLNEPPMPIVWTRECRNEAGGTNKIFTCTMGTSAELQEESFRRLLVNASYWALGMPSEIPAKSKVVLVGEYRTHEFGFNAFTLGVKPADLLLPGSATASAPSISAVTTPAPNDKKIVLFDGNKTDEWKTRDGAPANWPIINGTLEVGSADLETRRTFRDFQLHVEFWIPLYPPNVTGQKRGNSGIFLQKRYEVQILDSFGLQPGSGDCGAIYNQRAPNHNACTRPETWQTFDITFRSARYDSAGRKTENARVTVVQNGATIHSNVELTDRTNANSPPETRDSGSIKLQNHGDKIRFRNIWIIPQ